MSLPEKKKKSSGELKIKLNMNIIFASNSQFGLIACKAMLKEKVGLSAIITSSDKKMERGQKKRALPLKEIARENKIPLKEANNTSDFHLIVKKENPDIVIVAGFGLIISQKTLKLSSKFINIHPSLLPKYRGPTPIQTSIINGDQESGITLFLIDEKIDHGPIIDQRKVPFHQKINYKEAEEVLGKEGGMLAAEKVPLLAGKIKASSQNEKEATYTKKLTKKDGSINWNETAQIIERKVRAFNPWPGTYTRANGKTFKILKADIQKQTESGPFGTPGKVYLGTNNTLAVQTKKDFLLIRELQREGKSPVSSKDFLQGNIDFIGSVFS